MSVAAWYSSLPSCEAVMTTPSLEAALPVTMPSVLTVAVVPLLLLYVTVSPLLAVAEQLALVPTTRLKSVMSSTHEIDWFFLNHA